MAIKNILILTTDKFPNGDAGAIRELSLAKAMRQNGSNVVVLGLGDAANFQLKTIDGVKYGSLRYGDGLCSKVRTHLLYSRNLKMFLKKCGMNFDSILIVDIPVNALLYIKRYALKSHIKLIHDSVEWYSSEQFRHGKWSMTYLLKNKLNTKWIDKDFSVIAISSYLEHHFQSRAINTIRVPVVLDMEKEVCEKSIKWDKLTFLYAGSPGKKDYLKNVIRGFALLEEHELKRVELRLIGVNKEQLLSVCDVSQSDIDSLNNVLVIMGRVPHSDVLRNLEEADFTVLLRSETQRYAKAGFPTKVVESLASATPVICNLTSDLALYIKNAENGFVVEGCSPENLSVVIRRCLSLTQEQRELLQENARKTAEESFDYRLYADALNAIM